MNSIDQMIEVLAFTILRDRLAPESGPIDFKSYWDQLSQHSKDYYKECAFQYLKEWNGAEFCQIPFYQNGCGNPIAS